MAPMRRNETAARTARMATLAALNIAALLNPAVNAVRAVSRSPGGSCEATEVAPHKLSLTAPALTRALD